MWISFVQPQLVDYGAAAIHFKFHLEIPTRNGKAIGFSEGKRNPQTEENHEGGGKERREMCHPYAREQVE